MNPRMLRVFWLITNTIQAIFLGTWTALWITLAAIVSIFSAELPLVMARACWAPPLVWASGARLVQVEGAKLDPNAAYVFIMNHQSMFDIVAAFRLLPFNLRFIAKRELILIPFLGFYLWRTKMVLVDRSKPGQAYRALTKAANRLEKQVSVIAFPEGTRSKDGRIRAFKRGPFVLAMAKGLDIVPVAIEGSNSLLSPGGFNLRPNEVRVRIGEPIRTCELSDGTENVLALKNRTWTALVALHRSIGGAGSVEESPG